MPSVGASMRELWLAIGGPWWACAARRRGSSCRRPNLGGLDDDVLDRQPAVGAEPPDEVAAEPARALARERRDDDLVRPLVADRLHRRGVRVGMRDLAVRLDPLGAQRRERLPQPPLGLRVLAPLRGRSAGRRSGSSRRPRAARCRIRSSSGSPSTVSLATTSTFAPDWAAVVETTCSTGRGAATRRISSTRSRRSQPGLRLRVRRDDQLVVVLLGEDVLHRRERIDSNTPPCAGIARRAQRLERPLQPPARGGAARVLVDDVAGARLVHGRDDGDTDRARARPGA